MNIERVFILEAACLMHPLCWFPACGLRKTLSYQAVLDGLEKKGISIRVASPKLVMEEAPESYKDVTEVVNTCHDADISGKALKLRPIAVIKG